MLNRHLARNGHAAGHVREESVALWQRSNNPSVQIWEDLTQGETHLSLLDYADQLELERLEKIRSRARWADTALIPCVSYLALIAATLAIPWATIGQIEQAVFGVGLVSLWVVTLWRSITGSASPRVLTAIVLTRRLRPGERVWVHAVRPGFVLGIVTGRSRTRVVVRPFGQDTPIPLSPVDVLIVPQAGIASPVQDRSQRASASFSE